MAVDSFSLIATIRSQKYTDLTNTAHIITSPIASSAIFSWSTPTGITKAYSAESIGLNETFYAVYTFNTSTQLAPFSAWVITDPILKASNGFQYGTPVLTSANGSTLSNTINFDQLLGSITVSNTTLNQIITPGDTVRLSVPISILYVSAQNTFTQSFDVYLDSLSQGFDGITLNTLTLNLPQYLSVYLDTNWNRLNTAAPGDIIHFRFYFQNTGSEAITIPAFSLLNPLPAEAAFLGWGLTGDEQAPTFITYDHQTHRLVNTMPFTIPPYATEALSTIYAITIL